MRRSDSVFVIMAAQTACLLLLGAISYFQSGASSSRIALEAALVRNYGLTDLCLFSEVRYARNPSLADFHAAFQDNPAALDLFPSGSLLSPPAHISRKYVP